MKKAIMSVLTVWMLVTSMFIGLITFSDIETVQAPYIPHNPIRINSDAEFASMAGSEGWAGNGLPGSPYIIENYDINGSGYGYCIYIGNTTVYFEVKDSYLHEANGVGKYWYFPDCGIILYNVENGTITNNTVFFNLLGGIHLSHSSNNFIIDNKASNNDFGIQLLFSNSNIVSNNTALNNSIGIYIDLSSSNIITNNTASNNNNGLDLTDSDINTIANNTAISNNECGIILISSDRNTITNNTISSNNEQGIYIRYSNKNSLANNTISLNTQIGIYLYFSISHTIINNEMSGDGIFIWSNILEHWNTHIIDTSNTVNRKPVHYWKNQTGGNVPLGAGQIILANSTNVVIENQIVNDTSVGIELGFSNNNTITDNIASSNNWYGIYLYKSNSNIIANNNASSNNVNGIRLQSSNNNTIANNNASNNENGIGLTSSISNTIDNNTVSSNNWDGIVLSVSKNNKIINNIASDNQYGVHPYSFSNRNTIAYNTLSSNDNYGVYLSFSSNDNEVFHNNIIGNTFQAYDDTNNANQWHNGYPYGGNYWSDYIGNDSFKGSNQDIPGSDGIGDTPYIVDADSQDNYPLMEPFTNRTFENYTTLKQGWNLISIPFIQQNESLKKVLEMIDSWYDTVQWYNITDLNDPWKHYRPSKPFGNDLFHLNETMAFWIHITNPGDTIFLYNGTQPTSNQSIPLHTGWSMVGYPSLTNRNRTAALNNLTFGVEVDAIWTFNAATQTWEEINGGDYFEVGRGYWIHATQECVWEVVV